MSEVELDAMEAREGAKVDDYDTDASAAKATREHGIIEDLLRPALVEFVSTTLFLFFTLGHVCFNGAAIKNICADDMVGTAEENGCGPRFGAVGLTAENLTVESVAFSFGLMIFVLVYSTASLSGANINPAVTSALMATRRISLTKGILFIIAQCAGASLGCGLVTAVLPEGYLYDDKMPIGYNSVDTKNGFTLGGAFLGEMIGTSILMFTVMAAIDSNQAKAADHISKLAPLSIGIAVFLAHLVLVPVTNCSINPARTFGASIAAGDWSDHWIFWLAPISGAVITAFAYDLLFDERPDQTNCAGYREGPKGW